MKLSMGFSKISSVIFMMILIIPFNAFSSNSDAEIVSPKSALSPIISQIEENETNSVPFLEIENDITEVQVGNEITVHYGMKNDLDQFIGGYNFSLFLKTRTYNQSENIFYNSTTDLLLKKNMTKDFLDEFVLSTIKEPFLSANNYTIVYLVNTTNRGLLNATQVFEVIVKTGAEINVLFSLVSSDEFIDEIALDINENRTFSIIISNVGSGAAFNVSLGIADLNPPLGLTNIPISLVEPFTSDLFPSLTQVRINFSLSPSVFGIGKLQLDLDYSNFQGDNKFNVFTFTVLVLPQFEGTFRNGNQIVANNDLVQLSVSLGLISANSINISEAFSNIFVTLRLSSSKISFHEEERQYRVDIENYEFTGSVIEFGFIKVDFTITIYDENGNDEVEIQITNMIIEILSEPFPKPNKRLSDYLQILSVVLYLIFFIFVLVLYFQKDFRIKFVSRVLGMQVVEELKYKSDKIIIDGSNVAWESPDNNGKPQLANIFNAVKVLKEQGFIEIKIIADAALRYQIYEKGDLDNYTKSEEIKVVPAKVEADGFILRFAAKEGYMILSNDLFKEFRKIYNWIDKRRIPYTIMEKKIYLHPVYDLDPDEEKS